MMSIKPLLVLVAACSGSGEAPADVPNGPTHPFAASGQVNNPVSLVQSGRLVVGVARIADIPQKVLCDRFVVHTDISMVTLPSPYNLETDLSEGSWGMIALLLDGSGAPQAPATAYQIDVDADGVRCNRAACLGFDMYMQGTMAYDCP